MIDTVRFTIQSCPFPELVPAGWQRSRKRYEDDDSEDWREKTIFQHTRTDLRIGGSDGYASFIEVSLPKLVYPTNGFLLRAHEVNMAYLAALDLVFEVLDFCVIEKLTRYDLVHHFRGLASDFIASLYGLKHRAVRNKCVAFFDTGIEWPGSQTRIRLYDKRAEQEKAIGLIQRLEFQLRKKALRQVWSAEQGFDCESLYQHYKDLCGGFARRRVPRMGSLAEVLCWLKENNVVVNGIDPVERVLSSKGRSSRWRLQKAINGVHLDYFEANFLNWLPEKYSDLEYYDCKPRDLSIDEEVEDIELIA